MGTFPSAKHGNTEKFGSPSELAGKVLDTQLHINYNRIFTLETWGDAAMVALSSKKIAESHPLETQQSTDLNVHPPGVDVGRSAKEFNELLQVLKKIQKGRAVLEEPDRKTFSRALIIIDNFIEFVNQESSHYAAEAFSKQDLNPPDNVLPNINYERQRAIRNSVVNNITANIQPVIGELARALHIELNDHLIKPVPIKVRPNNLSKSRSNRRHVRAIASQILDMPLNSNPEEMPANDRVTFRTYLEQRAKEKGELSREDQVENFGNKNHLERAVALLEALINMQTGTCTREDRLAVEKGMEVLDGEIKCAILRDEAHFHQREHPEKNPQVQKMGYTDDNDLEECRKVFADAYRLSSDTTETLATKFPPLFEELAEILNISYKPSPSIGK